MKKCQFPVRKISRRVSILLITFGLSVIVASRPVQEPPHSHSAISTIDTNDTLGISIDPAIKDSFPYIYNLLSQLISEKKGIFREPAFFEFFSSPATRLVFSEQELPEDVGAESHHAGFAHGYFRDTIFINGLLYARMSKEYLTSVVIHEGIHAYITWCCVCYAFNRQFGVDEGYLKKHFHSDWKWLTDSPYVDNDQEHILMSENFFRVMTKHLRVHCGQSDPGLRADIAEALTFGGLYKTARWRRSNEDTCYLNSIDIWSRNMNASDSIATRYGNCAPKRYRLFTSASIGPSL